MRSAATLALLALIASGCDTRRQQTEHDQADPATAGRASKVGEATIWTFTVVETKFARRRQMHFLSSSLNFRGSENQAIAIAAADFGAFRDAGIEELDVAYLGKKITAHGTLFEDEGQLLLRVTSPRQIELND
jgi:hypothetical protein